MHRDVREVLQLSTRMNGALNAVVAGNIDCFHLFWIVPAPSTGDGPLSRIKHALSPASWLSKDVLLVPLDELDLQPIPCGPGGDGYPLTLPSDFYKDHAAAIKFTYTLLKYACKAGKLVGLRGPAEAMGELIDNVCDTAGDKLSDAVNSALDDAVADMDPMSARMMSALRTGGEDDEEEDEEEEDEEEEEEDDDEKGEDAGEGAEKQPVAKATEAVGAAYHKLKALMDEKHPSWRQSMGGGPRTSAGGRVGWVRAENFDKWEASASPSVPDGGAQALGSEGGAGGRARFGFRLRSSSRSKVACYDG
jgi:hypothetical protein